MTKRSLSDAFKKVTMSTDVDAVARAGNGFPLTITPHLLQMVPTEETAEPLPLHVARQTPRLPRVRGF
jgi:hypothetical protein